MYNYLESMKDDIRDAIDGYDLEEWRDRKDDFQEKLNADLWIDDAVTGNGSGSYSCSAEAKERVLENIELCVGAMQDFGVDCKTIGEKLIAGDWDYFDVAIRCSLLGQAIADVLSEFDDGLWDDIPEDE